MRYYPFTLDIRYNSTLDYDIESYKAEDSPYELITIGDEEYIIYGDISAQVAGVTITPVGKNRNPKDYTFGTDVKAAGFFWEIIRGVTGVTPALPDGSQRHRMNAARLKKVPQPNDYQREVSLTGFVSDTNPNFPNYDNMVTRISGNAIWKGYDAQPWTMIPNNTLNTAVKNFISNIEAELSTKLPSYISYTYYRLNFSGILFGNGGYHFPR